MIFLSFLPQKLTFPKIPNCFGKAITNAINSPVLCNLRAGIYGVPELKALSGLFLLLSLLWVSLCACGGSSQNGKSSRITGQNKRLSFLSICGYWWFLVSGLWNVLIDGYFTLFPNLFAQKHHSNNQNLLCAIWEQYALHIDDRAIECEYWRVIVSFCSLLAGPCSLLVAFCCKNNIHYRFPAQIFVSTIRMTQHALLLFTRYDWLFAEANWKFLLWNGTFIVASIVSIFYSIWQIESLYARAVIDGEKACLEKEEAIQIQ